jgi:hypothetical protein
LSRALHQRECRKEHRTAKEYREQEALGQVGDKQCRSRTVEAEAGFEPECAPDGKGQVDDAREEKYAADDDEAEPRLGPAGVAPKGIDGSDAASDGQGEGDHGVHDLRDAPEARLGDRVIGRFRVLDGGDASGEGFRNVVAVGGDGGDLTLREPQL